MAQRNGTTADDIFVAHADSDYLKGQLTFVLGATPSQGGWPAVDIYVNGTAVLRNYVITSYVIDGKTEVLSVPLPAGPITSVGIRYTNDLVTTNDDRNVYVGSVTLNGTQLALNSGVYVRDDYPTIAGDSALNWNGTMTWSGSVVSNAMSTGVRAESHMFNGGDGVDFATYQGRMSGYSVAYAADGGISVSNARAGFSDGLFNVENILFDDRGAYGGGFDAAIDVSANTVDGGRGMDTLVLKGNHTAYIISHTTTGFAIAGNGIDQWVTNVERLKFEDGMVALDIEGQGGQAYRLYKAAFDRTPDLEGLGFWIHSLEVGVSVQQAAAFFMQSAEFNSLYGSPTNSQFVTLLYQNVLDRAPDQAGFDYWLPLLQNGTLTRADVLVLFSESTENKANVIGQIDDGIFYDPYN